MRTWWIRAGLLVVGAAAVGFGVTHAVATPRDPSGWLQHVSATRTNSTAPVGTVPTPQQAQPQADTLHAPAAGTTSQQQAGHAVTATNSASGANPAAGAVSSHASGAASGPPASSQGATASRPSTPASGSGSTGQPAATRQLGTFTIIVSEDHGQKVLADKQVPIVGGESLMAYMHQYFAVETAYNDEFVVSIDGIRSQWTGVPADQRKPIDWFLYVNSQEAPVSAAAIYPHAGDVDTWDYHQWDPSTGR